MPLYSEHKSNMYYSGSPTYNPYSSYTSPISSLGTSYSASYLNPGGSYSNHSSISSYSRPPLSSRWIPGLSRSYSPMLTSISERGTSSPVRINSPRRIPFSKRSYGTSGYTQRPININTADIDVSRDKYRRKSVETPAAVSTPCKAPLQKELTIDEKEKSPFMPRVDGKPETGIDSSPGVKRNTIMRGRTVVRLHTVKRRERDSPRKPVENVEPQEVQNAIVESSVVIPVSDIEIENNESKSWREKLSEDLNYPEKKEKKSLGTKFVETHLVKHDNDQAETKTVHTNSRIEKIALSLPTNLQPSEEVPLPSRSPDRRCSMELLAEQASVLDALIKGENLSTAIAPLDLSKVGIAEEDSKAIIESINRKKSSSQENPLKTTKSDQSLHENLNSLRNKNDSKSLSKRRSLKKSFSGGSISRLDSITELPKDLAHVELPAIEEIQTSIKKDTADEKLQIKPKTKIIASVDISAPASPLKFRIENITVEEKVHVQPKPKKEITFSSTVEDTLTHDVTLQSPLRRTKEMRSIKRKSKNISDPTSPEPEDGNFWDKIGKRETVYLMKRKQNLDEVKEKNRRAIFWYPENGEPEFLENAESSDVEKTDILSEINESFQCVVVHEDNNSKNELDLPIKHMTKSESSMISNVNNNAEQGLNEDISNKQSILITVNNSCSIISIEPDIIIKNKIEEKQENNTKDSKKVKNPKPDSKNKLKSGPNISQSKTSPQPDNTELSETKNSKESSDTVKINDPKEDIMLLTKIIESKIKTPNNNNEIENISPMTVDNINSFEKTLSVEESGSATKDSLNTLKLEQHDKLAVETDNKLPSNNEIKDAVKQDLEKVITNTLNSLSNTDKKPEITLFKLHEESAVHVNEDIVTPVLSPEADTKSNKVKDSASKKLISAKNSKILNKKPAANTSPKFKEFKMVQICPVHGEINKTDDRSASGTTKNDAELTTSVSEIILPAESNTSTPVDLSTETEEQPTLSTAATASIEPSNDTSSKTDLQLPIIPKPENIPKISTHTDAEKVQNDLDVEKKVEEPKSGTKNEQDNEIKQLSLKNHVPFVAPSPKKPVKEEKALKPLIATPRPLQKRVPQVIHSSESSDSSSEEESSEEDEESESSEESAEFYECENNADGRTSTGSNDSGFDSSAPTSPATFMQIKKDCDVNCHRKCEKLTANLCGVNQRLLVEALATRTASKKGAESPGPSSSNATSQLQATDISEQELEQSTAYGIFRKTGRFTPPARSIPRFRKYTVEDFQFIKVLGKGSFGKVLLAELRDTEYYYAVKCLKKDVVLEDDDVECTLIERKVLALGTNHPYLCHLFATFQTDSHLFFVMEYLNGGDLMFHIQQSGRFPEARARFYAAEIVSGLKFLHKRGIVYRDLKLDNILLDFDGHVRIADFGMCKLQIYLEKTADTFCGTPDYMAPEIIKGLKYNQTVDWWSFGVLLYEMLIGQSPFSGCDEDELFWSICNEMPSYPRFLSQQALTILTRLLDKDARTRLGGVECMHGDIRDQDFFHQIPWERLERRDLEAPFRPRVRHPLDTQYFDRAFTGERPRLTAVEPQVLRSMDQEPFRGFSYTNPNATDR